MDREEVEVSIICATFNQERYIKHALESILSQETTFRFEIIVRDDASTDCTQTIVEDLVSRYPERIVYIREPVNTYLDGERPLQASMPHARGRYIAICEGDDFWTRKDKLQRQYEALESNPSIDLCFHPAWQYRDDKRAKVICDYASSDYVMSLRSAILLRGGGMPSASLFIRRSAIYPLPDWFLNHAPVGDSFIQALGSRNGGAYYIATVMSAYRKYTPGSRTFESASRRYTENELTKKMEGYRLSYAGLDQSLMCAESEAVSEALLDEMLHLAVLALVSDQCEVFEEALDGLRFNTVRLKPRRVALFIAKKMTITRPLLKSVIKFLMLRNLS